MSLFFLRDKVIYRPGSRTVCFSREPSYRYLAQRCISIQSKILSLLFHMDLSPPSPSLFFSSSGLFLRDVNPTEGCAGCAGGGIREARRRLVRCGTLSLKYPEVFFPRNCRSPSFLGSLNGPGYPGRIEKLPACSLSLFLSFSLSLSFLLIFLVPASFFFYVSPREAIYTRLRLANSRPLLDDDKAHRACMRSRGFSRIYCGVRK